MSGVNKAKANAYRIARELMPSGAGYDHAEAWRFALWLLDAEDDVDDSDSPSSDPREWGAGDVIRIESSTGEWTVLVRDDDGAWLCSMSGCDGRHTDDEVSADQRGGYVTVLAVHGRRVAA